MHALVDHFEETHVFAPKPDNPRLFVLPEERPPCPLPRLVIPFPRFLTPPPVERASVPYDSPSSPLWSDGLPSPTLDDHLLPYASSKPQVAPSPSIPPASFSPYTSRVKSRKVKPLKDRERIVDGRSKTTVGSDSSPIKRDRGTRSRDRGRNFVCSVRVLCYHPSS